ncbi:hypothetical protein [Granulicella mallensis]|uniref:Transmembrane protein n=1 Tax=Granulicella mallensis TaxID=940614 RepID=A0A7W7ZQI0_9BACT|nr:hypothetical protein [Granulicella mallensis]MBB5063929.1 hypothetical protein [Granulicella mallensis]
MKRVGPLLSLMQQAGLALTIGVIASLSWFVQILFRSHSRTSFTLWFLLYFVVGLGTFIASIWISYDLRTGIESGRWPETEIERFRTIFDKPWLNGLNVTLAFAAVFFMFFELLASHLHHVPGYGYGLLFFSQILSQFSMAVRRPRPRSTDQHIDWRNAPPITSDHWGSPS